MALQRNFFEIISRSDFPLEILTKILSHLKSTQIIAFALANKFMGNLLLGDKVRQEINAFWEGKINNLMIFNDHEKDKIKEDHGSFYQYFRYLTFTCDKNYLSDNTEQNRVLKYSTKFKDLYVLARLGRSNLLVKKIKDAFTFAKYLTTIKNAANVKAGVDEIMKFRNQIPEQYRGFIDPGFKQAFNKISAAQKANGNNELGNYIGGLLK